MQLEEAFAEAQRRAEDRVEACEEALAAEQSDDPDDELWPPDMLAAYDGCTRCMVREALHAAWKLLVDVAQREAT